MKHITSQSSRRSGFTLLEMTLGMTLMLLLTGALLQSLQSIRGLTTTTGNRANLQTMGDRALLRIMTDLRSSGTDTVAGRDYPYVFRGGVPEPLFAVHAHPPAQENANPGDPDFGPDREIVYLLPQDLDGDRRPDLDANGDLLWSANEMSLVVNTRADGINYLEQRTDGGAPRVLARDVERVVFDDAESSGFQIPLGSVRVRLFFRRTDTRGTLIRYRNEAVVNLRNG